ncbi:FG-GAP repeat domain-containing protein [Brevibacillus sp. TJ4]|uniref:FG-GAP repeat domain-containing protein n=1 Tax=Brevibacillus sp. TJ4 TaxID=3234853 RepID=UPI003BA0C5B6
MNKIWRCSVLLLALLAGGCGVIETPNELMRAPSADGDYRSINQAVMQYLPAGAQLTIPLQPDEASAVTLQDLDNDGKPEVIAFYKPEKTDYEIGVLILEQNQGRWEKLASFTNVGSELDYVNFADLTGDNVPEILIGLGGGDQLNKELTVYSLDQGGIQEIIKQPYSVMAVGELTQNGQTELALVLHNHNQLTSTVQLYGLQEDRLTMLTETRLEGDINGYERALIGKASADTNGLFLEAGLGAHSASTELLIWDNGELRNPLTNAELGVDPTFKPYPLYSEDIDQDGLIEVGIHVQPAGSEDLPLASVPWISAYYQWDGKDSLIHVQDHYRNYVYGIDFQIPEKWGDAFTLEEDPEPDSRVVNLFYYDEESKDKALLLSLQAIPLQEWKQAEESLKQQRKNYVLLKETGKLVHVAVQPDAQPHLSGASLAAYNSMLLTADEIRQLYRTLPVPL